MRIKLFESFLDSKEQDKLKKDINDVLVEIADLGFRWEIYISKTLANWMLCVDIGKDGEQWGEEAHEVNDADYGVAEIYESVMLLVGFMRDKYPDVEVRYELSSNDDEQGVDEFLEENDIETIDDFSDTPLNNIYNFQVIFSGDFDFRKNK
jgi:hypothetical protein